MTTRAPLTARQAEIVAFISEFARENGVPPTVREIGAHFGIGSTNGVNDHLKYIERKGWIVRQPGKSRAIRVIGYEAPTDRVFAWDALNPSLRAGALVWLRRKARAAWPANVASAMIQKLGAP